MGGVWGKRNLWKILKVEIFVDGVFLITFANKLFTF